MFSFILSLVLLVVTSVSGKGNQKYSQPNLKPDHTELLVKDYPATKDLMQWMDFKVT